MIKIGKTIVSPDFDSGSFMNSFTVTNELNDRWGNQNIQSAHNLDFDDFKALSLLIAGVVDKYLQGERSAKIIIESMGKCNETRTH